MAGIRERLVQLTVRAREFLSGDLKPATDAMRGLSEEGRRLKDELAEAGRARGLVRTLRDTEGATGSLEQAWRDAQATLDDLTREIGDSEQATAGQRIALREARRTADEAQSAYERSQRAIKNLRTELKALNVDTGNLGSEEDRLTAEIKQNKQAVDDNREAIKQKRVEEKKAAEAAQEHASRVDAARGALASGAKQVLAFTAAFVGLDALFGAVGRGLDLVRGGIVTMLQTGDQFEGLQTRMNALMGSVAAGEAATAWVKEFAKNTPLELQDVTDAFAQLQAYGVDPMNGTLQALVDQNEKLGGGMERLQGIISAVGQAYAKQKLQTEEILQLVERGVPVWDMLSKVTGKNAADLQELASKGKLGRDVLAALVKEIGNLSAGAAAANMDRLSGIISNLKDQATDFYNRIANAGALEYVKDQLKQLSDRISQMAADGSLDALAKGLSDAFVQGVEKVKEFAFSLGEVDFRRLVDDSAAWLSDFGGKIDQAARAITLVAAPFRALGNVVTGSLSAIGVAFTSLMANALTLLANVAKVIPDVFWGREIVNGIYSLRDNALGVFGDLVDQVEQDGSDIADTWRSVADDAEDSAERSAAAFRRSSEDIRTSLRKTGEDIQAHFRQNITSLEQGLAAVSFAETTAELDEIKAALERAKLPAGELEQVMAALEQRRGFVSQSVDMTSAADKLAAAVEKLRAEQKQLEADYRAGEISLEAWQQRHNEAAQEIVKLQSGLAGAKVEVTSLAGALDGIDSAQSVQQLELMRVALLEAYRSGRITQEEFAQGTTALSGRMKELKGSASGAADGVSNLEEKLGDLQSVQQAISSAKTDVDINNIRTALRKLYNDGKIGSAEYNAELERLNERQKELKGAVQQGTKAQQDKNKADEDAIVTSEQLRRESGKRMEAERQAGDAAMQARRKGSEEAKRDMSAVEGFFGGVLTRAREPLAGLSKAALDAYDKLRGIKSADLELDTSSLEATAKSLDKVNQQLDATKAALSNPLTSSLGKWAANMQRTSLETQKAYLGQKAALQSLMERYESGQMTLAGFANAAAAAKSQLGLLDDSDLSGLESAIKSAKEQMKQLGESTRGTLESLQDELDGLEGREADIQRRRFSARQRELQAQLAEAQASGDANAVSNAARALGVLRQIEAATEQQRVREEQQKRIEADQKSVAAPVQPVTPSKIIRLEVKGQAVDVAVSDSADETKLLSLLEEAGLRSL
ncbi:MAG: hypothetical protein E6Q69_03245 [Aquipseudomonas alcaligenes]|uniref:Tape measure protein N-terminal domain-containing protein n=1 Tax=Aquipseudomonas alcaligenes TaxID=43263 RepID=A0A5C7WB97_AQUAC|nr:MAG: hypothetical protein E6Q69_03245 [Pseudomonas alcaligenes]